MQNLQNQALPDSIDALRAQIDNALAEGVLGAVETPLTHYHTDQLYGRRIVVPAGAIFTTKVHKSDHISIALRGHITIITESGEVKEVKAPDAFVTPAGTQRAVYVHEEVEFMTVHHCEENDLDKIEAALGCTSMAEYEQQKLLGVAA